MTVTLVLNISALCASVTVGGSTLYSGRLPCAFQQNFRPSLEVIDLKTVTGNLQTNCDRNFVEVGQDSAPFHYPANSNRDFSTSGGAVPDPALPDAPTLISAVDADPNDITSSPGLSPNVDLPEPSGLIVLTVGVGLLAATRRRGTRRPPAQRPCH